jgi:serine phosphatase RsbU (regulator of sigma subunit)/CHASE3 domain sensor protein
MVVAVAVAGAILVGIAIGGMVLASGDYRNAGLRAVNRQAAANQILIDLLNAETGNRGYTLTGRGDYLEPYLRARDRYGEDIARLRRLVRGEPSLEQATEEVDRTAQLWFAEAVTQIRLRRQGRVQDAVARVNEDVAKARIDAFRAAHDRLLREVAAVRERALSDADRTRSWTLAAVSAAALIALLVVIGAVIQLWRRMGIPVALVADGVARVAHGRFSEPVPATEGAVAELAELTAGFNEMQAQLSEQRDAVAAAARREAAQAAERELWSMLQAGLLPQELPRVPGVRLVARYEPAERGLLLGGDFYDALLLSDGRLALAVGDLAGHGAPVAARAAGLRFGWRTLVEVNPDPATVIHGLNRQLAGPRERSEGLFASLVYALLAPDGTMQIASAGHPPPVLLAERCRPLRMATGPVLGVMDDPRWPVVEVAVPPGATLVFFTDGLTEARRGTDFFGEERTCLLLEQERAAPLEARVERLIAAARRHDERGLRDDVVVLAVERSATQPDATARPGGSSSAAVAGGSQAPAA